MLGVLRGGPTALRIGRHVRELERVVAESFGKRRGIMCNSGSSALYLAIELLGLAPGDELGWNFEPAQGIDTRRVWTGNAVRQPALRKIAMRVDAGGLANADRVMEQGLILPMNRSRTSTCTSSATRWTRT